MLRTLLAGGVLTVVLVAGCCRMGQHPYDECGPVWSQGGRLNCNPDCYRAGSIISGGPAPGRIEPIPARPAGPLTPIPEPARTTTDM
ncbi:MAG: hypothetical protein ABR915_20260 [Thermoguttaceae bacterium]|jgi:hypothetical protein